MGQEFGQPGEWNHDTELPWALAGTGPHAGVSLLVRDLNRLMCEQPALHRLDAEAAGFEWLAADEREASLFAWVRRDGDGGQVIMVSNMTPVPRQAWRLGVPEGPWQWREVLNTDSAFYGGSNLGNGPGALATTDAPAHGRARSLSLTLPPLATLFLVPA